MPSVKSSSGFGMGNILGLIFILIGILFALSLLNYKLPINLKGMSTMLQYGAALGSILGGISMLFKRKEATQQTIQLK